ncbi:hypothetical protein IWW55_002291 [Coemansia sp. RSA 2706]|nr:hypothetical protein LPJ63_001817 [Coemansia sp. RSA 2711]KAJ2304724.1 hypothetical protein IWW55_002291 [Coemansia sp. RSA 2706]KAJ2308725.1 hypothetical protein IWW54_003992 [Coemansia sp. RSA 2705]KAJ2316331.1 hypothetical protein IWW52_003705 [Coemansia sp. RSA 2704]KAJ2326894.1 hypothetical protein IWW51_002041 [Coemansia sp. RSA 2702]KAJ2728716.1 hypothetical protein H4R23_003595 [Coemansia sp. Cherry 401B]
MRAATESSVPPSQGTAPAPPPQPGVPVERHPYNDDWGTTFVAILLMALLVFVALGLLVRKSFQLVPTGVMSLRTLVGRRRPDGYHRLGDEDNEDAQVGRDSVDRAVAGEEDQEDARIIHIGSEPPTPRAIGNAG